MAKGPFFIAVAATVGMIIAGASIWLALAVLALWCGSLWLVRPAAPEEAASDRRMLDQDALLAAFLDPVDAPLLLIDRGRISSANRAAREALGGHIVGQDVRVALRHPAAVGLINSDQPDAAKMITIEGLTSPRSRFEMQLHQIDDRYRLVQLTDRSREGDVSRAHTDFVANASHELRTPLASIIGYSETLRDDEGAMDKATRNRFLDTMLRESNRMRALIDDLMSLSRIEAEKHQRPSEKIDLVPVAQAIAKDVAAIHGGERIRCSFTADHAMILGDHAQIDQLIRNLVDNALKYGSAIEPVTLAISSDARHIIFVVQDRGQGIDPDQLPHLTRRFYRTDPGRSQAAGGTGLGLAIVKHIVERHRATLDIASKVGEGTTVSVRFPRAVESVAETNYDNSVTELS